MIYDYIFGISGYYCDMANEPMTNYTSFPCPAGYYCPNGTRFDTEYPCPAGTYNPVEKLEAESECYDCDPGKYCLLPGETAVTADCAAGWWCILGMYLIINDGKCPLPTPFIKGGFFQRNHAGFACIKYDFVYSNRSKIYKFATLTSFT